MHSRIVGECKFPDVEPEKIWTCPGCARKPQPRPRGHADHNDIEGECRWATAASRLEVGRKGRHPREARLRGSDDPSAGLRGEDLVPETDTAPAADPAEADIRDPIGRAPRAARAIVVDRAVGGSSDWTSFDVSKSLRMLRTGSPSDITRTLRKLHLRWWHATRTQMEKMLHAAGVPQGVLDKIP